MRLCRRSLLAAAVVSWSCGKREGEAITLPAELPGGFRKRQGASVPEAAWPDMVRRLRCEAAYRGEYEGGTGLAVTVYRMTASSSAFELAQKWRPAAGVLFFHAGALFVTLETPGASHAALNEVAKALEAHLR
jgi:hypothetical protein